MSAFCHGCGAYLTAGHDEQACRAERQRETNARGAAAAREALNAARADLAAHTTDSEETP